MGSCDCSFSLVSTNSQAPVLSYSTRILWTSPLYDSCWLTGPLLVCHTYSALPSSLSICSHCRSHLGLILKILFVPGRTVFPFAFLPPLTSFSFLSFFRSFLLLLSSFLLLYRLVGPFPYFCDSLFALKRPVSRALFDFHISSHKFIRVSRFFPLCAPSIIFMTLSFTHEIHQMIREFLFPPCPVWVSNPFPMFARSIAFPNSLIFASFAFSVLLEFFLSSSHLTYASPNFFSPPWCLQLRKFHNFPVLSPAGGFAL